MSTIEFDDEQKKKVQELAEEYRRRVEGGLSASVRATVREALRRERIHIEMCDLEYAHKQRELARIDEALDVI